MERLASDDQLLKDDFGNVAQRDIVQFVPFEEFGRNPFKLREEVLQELPDQVVQYYLSRNIKPQKGRFGLTQSHAVGLPRLHLRAPEHRELGPRAVCGQAE